MLHEELTQNLKLTCNNKKIRIQKSTNKTNQLPKLENTTLLQQC